jgi:hypothetical protein
VDYSLCAFNVITGMIKPGLNAATLQRLRLARDEAAKWNSEALLHNGVLGQCAELTLKQTGPAAACGPEGTREEIVDSLSSSCIRGHLGCFSAAQAGAVNAALQSKLFVPDFDQDGKAVPAPDADPSNKPYVPGEDPVTQRIDQCLKDDLNQAAPSCFVKRPVRDSFGNITAEAASLAPIQANYLGESSASTIDAGRTEAAQYRIGEIRTYLRRLRAEMVKEVFKANRQFIRDGAYQVAPDSKCAKIPEIQQIINVEAANAPKLSDIGPREAAAALSAAANAKAELDVHQLIADALEKARVTPAAAAFRRTDPTQKCPTGGTLAEWKEAASSPNAILCGPEDEAALKRDDQELKAFIGSELANPYVRAGMDEPFWNFTEVDGKLHPSTFPMIDKLTAALGPGDPLKNFNASVAGKSDAQIAALPEVQAALAVLKGDGKRLLRKDLGDGLDALCDDTAWLRLARAKGIARRVIDADDGDDLFPAIQGCFDRYSDELAGQKAKAELAVGVGCGIAALIPGLNVMVGVPCLGAFFTMAAKTKLDADDDKNFTQACGLGKLCSIEEALNAAEQKADASHDLALQAAFVALEALGPALKGARTAVREAKAAQLAELMRSAELAEKDRLALDELNRILKGERGLTQAQIESLTARYLRGEIKSAEGLLREAKLAQLDTELVRHPLPISPEELAGLRDKLAGMQPEELEKYYGSAAFGKDLEAASQRSRNALKAKWNVSDSQFDQLGARYKTFEQVESDLRRAKISELAKPTARPKPLTRAQAQILQDMETKGLLTGRPPEFINELAGAVRNSDSWGRDLAEGFMLGDKGAQGRIFDRLARISGKERAQQLVDAIGRRQPPRIDEVSRIFGEELSVCAVPAF